MNLFLYTHTYIRKKHTPPYGNYIFRKITNLSLSINCSNSLLNLISPITSIS
ncbi:hypothetical protein HanRHA438_Chr04g0157781 [Helianthus annuus]|nr:hypothetical protein HanRHA438_Chr04g0157781 [Helianthus annuus]